MANSSSDRAVIDLVINGQQAQTSLKQVSLEVTRATAAIVKMKETDAGYNDKLKELHALLAAQRQMRAQINDTTTAWGRFKSNIASTAVGVLGGDILGTALSAVTGAITSSIAKIREFDAASRELSAVTGATGRDLEFLNQTAARTGPEFGKSGAQMLEAYKLMASAKPELLDQKELLVETTKAAITLSQAGSIPLAEATLVTAESLNQFGESADQANRFINVIAAGAKEGSAEIADMGVALKNSGTVAKAQGVSFEQTNAILQSLSTIALKGGEAGTGLRNVLLTLGSGSDDTNPKVVGLEKALENLGKKNLSTTEMLKLFGKENITAAQHIITHRGEIAELTKKITGTQEAFSQAEKNNKSLDHQLEVFYARVSGLGVLLGTYLVPAFTKVVDVATDLTKLLTGQLTPASEVANQAFEEQRQKVNNLTNNINPLLNRYDELKKKSVLTKDEQGELNKIINQVAKTIPSAVSQFDAYGRAMDINTDKARKAIEVQQALLEHYNKTAITETTSERDRKIQQLNAARAKREAGITVDEDLSAVGGGYRKMTEAELKAVDDEIELLNAEIDQRNTLLQGLTGYDKEARRRRRRGEPEPSVTPPDPTPTPGGSGGSSGLTEEQKKAKKKQEEAKQRAEELEKAKKKQEEEAKQRAEEQKKAKKREDANHAAILRIEKMKADALKDERERELAQVQFEADRARETVRNSKQSAELKATEIKAIESKLLADKQAIEDKYTLKLKEEEEKRLEELRKGAEAELELKKKIREAEIAMEVANGNLTKEEGDKGKLNAEEAFLEAKRILNEAHFQSLIDLYQNFADKKQKIEQDQKTSSAQTEGEIVANQADQATARQAITQAEVKSTEQAAEAKKKAEKESFDQKKKIFNDSVTVLKTFFKENTIAYKAAFIAQQAWALGEVAIAYSTAVMKSIAAASGIPFPGNILAIAKSIAIPTLEAAAAVANIKAQKFDTPGFADGGFTGAGDGPAGFVDSPTLFTMGSRRYIAGEAGREFVISNQALQHPVVADFARIMDVAQRTNNYSLLTPSASAAAQTTSAGQSTDMLALLIREQQVTREQLSSALIELARRPISLDLFALERKQEEIEYVRNATKG